MSLQESNIREFVAKEIDAKVERLLSIIEQQNESIRMLTLAVESLQIRVEANESELTELQMRGIDEDDSEAWKRA